MWLMPSCAASLRVLQCVEPSAGLRLTLHSKMRLHCRRERRGQLTRVPAEEPRQTLRQETLAPAIDEAVRAVQLVADPRPRVPAVEQQDEPRTACLVGTPRLTGGALSEFRLFHFRQNNRVAHEHDYTRF